MAARTPPIPPDQRSDKGPGVSPAPAKPAGEAKAPITDRNAGQSGAVKQNTTNQGLQQDR